MGINCKYVSVGADSTNTFLFDRPVMVLGVSLATGGTRSVAGYGVTALFRRQGVTAASIPNVEDSVVAAMYDGSGVEGFSAEKFVWIGLGANAGEVWTLMYASLVGTITNLTASVVLFYE